MSEKEKLDMISQILETERPTGEARHLAAKIWEVLHPEVVENKFKWTRKEEL
jgi:hypothetical protein